MRASLPQISISLAPPEEILEEPYSPFSPQTPTASEQDDGFRPQHLSPPPTGSSPRFPRQLSPLRPPDSPVQGFGLERDRFEAMLKASKERSVAVGSKRAQDLRKEIALKAHKSKQVERRALFLSKLQAPPSPSATSTPKTPPESPAIFHYSLPSPGLNSPLSLFDAIGDDSLKSLGLGSVEPWVEQVDFRLPGDVQSKSLTKSAMKSLRDRLSKPGKPIPSLDQITAHLSSHAQLPTFRQERSSARLPAFLQSQKDVAPTEAGTASSTEVAPPSTIDIGRLRMPIRASRVTCNEPSTIPSRIVTPASPHSPVAPKLQVTTTIVAASATLSPTELSESNLFVVASRARTAQDMLSTLKRRTHLSEEGLTGHETDDEERNRRRRSSPAEMMKLSRSGFEHPVLSLPGGF